jgi:ferric-dicitrate binding protein FerR (iron transport regulator)
MKSLKELRFTWPDVKAEFRTNLGLYLWLFFMPIVIGVGASIRDGREPTQVRMARWADSALTSVVTAAGQDSVVTLPGGARAVLRENSGVAWPKSGTPIRVDGNLLIDVPPTLPELRLITPSGDMRLWPGRYALAKGERPDIFLVTVAEGRAQLRPDTASTTMWEIAPGEFGQITRKTAYKFGADSASRFPVVPAPSP